MNDLKKYLAIVIIAFSTFSLKAQGTLPIYSDYLSDNVFLVHPAAAGIGNSAKFRLTHRQQWSDNEDAPSLQTLTYHQGFGKGMALGGMLFNDKNGYHSQLGVRATYAYHLNFGRDDALNQLSLSLSGSYVQNSLDQRSFTAYDPIISQVIESDHYVNADFSAAYFNLDGYVYLTAKNLLLNTKNSVDNNYNSLNLRTYLLNMGYFFGWEKRFQVEPSVMLQYVEKTGEFNVDLNAKVYKLLDRNKRIWFALSYRQSLDGNKLQELSQLTPIAGFEIDRYLLSYTYTHQLGNVTFANGGFHQFTLGINLFNKRPKDQGYIPRFNPFLFKNDN
ncbi:type IX secretion system membrane protein PorP/SprF [Aureibaculum algae]|uniref:Type IX secretion system membrane protein PorP/SprF n=1 Tax=Aureibaculum algae TaxID=2584122 RepID=A0A5B7TR84_9FLAO|nr:type IX secretion system membrane protein PorP/SprF [Aureibaculum algae]QCX37467.1 type IX secretion system membrane protein PorP/SprF [Aureibaculum algae]